MTLVQALSAFLRDHSDGDERDLAALFLTRQPRAAFVDLLAEEIIHIRRAQTRFVEAAALATLPPSTNRRSSASAIVDLGGFSLLLDQRYRVGDGSERRAREMTLGEWEARRAMLLGQAAGIARAIEVCDRAIELIRTAGLRTLGDLEGEAVAA